MFFVVVAGFWFFCLFGFVCFFLGGGCFCYDHNSRRYNWKNLGVMKNPEFAFPLLKIKCYVGHHLDAKVVSKYITSKVISEVMK